jgi:hypothetical protein
MAANLNEVMTKRTSPDSGFRSYDIKAVWWLYKPLIILPKAVAGVCRLKNAP